MNCDKCNKKMKLISSWVEGNETLSEYKCECGHTQIIKRMKIENKKDDKLMLRQVPDWAQVHLTKLLQDLKDKLPDNFEKGKYTVSLILWTDNSFQVTIDSTEITDDDMIKHTFSWNESTGYLSYNKKEGDK